MALTAGDKADIRVIVEDVVEDVLERKVGEVVERKIQPLRDMMDVFDRRQDAMMDILSPLLYDRHRYSDLRERVRRTEEFIAEVQERQSA